jgi:hypothetical protein
MSSGRTPEEYRAFFADVFSEMDARPRKFGMKIRAEGLTVDFADGLAEFKVAGGGAVKADFGRRWLAEHPVPLTFGGRTVYLTFEPAGGNRVRVRKASFGERLRA